MAGEKLTKYKLKYKTNKRYAVKGSLSLKIPNSDVLLGPEMKSTGEVMGFDEDTEWQLQSFKTSILTKVWYGIFIR